ncbi:MAG TPA: aminodeoxychorismate synthase component I [Pseudomonadota bacterium]|nr:aminodeoxychorismate synthase component I [Pseudomonadota bacterium]
MLSDTAQPEEHRRHLLLQLELRLPLWRYFAAVRRQRFAFLLDSAKDPDKLGQYSFLGADPFCVFTAKHQRGAPPGAGAHIELSFHPTPDGPPQRQRSVGDPLAALRRLLRTYAVAPAEYSAQPVPLLSGAVGYIGYEAGYFIESLPDLGEDDLELPDIWLLLCDSLLAHCHRTGRSYLSVIGRGADPAAAAQKATAAQEKWLQLLTAFEAAPDLDPEPPPDGEPAELQLHAHFDRARYCQAVETVKEHIFAGDAYEVCLSHRLDAAFTGDPLHLYAALRRINPAPFASLLKLDELYVLSSSPERFLRLGADRVAESRPIKGTRPRGRTPEEDAALYRELGASIKDRAENSMIVDLVRNDLGRIAKFGSVHVPELMIIETYATVFQLVSTIRATLEDAVDAVELLRACFPGGSMTGAPKIEAMKLIDSLEPVKRGIYAGSIGYLDFAGSLDLSIVIRTLVLKGGRCYFSVGGAVVADSDPGEEYAETLAKAQALIAALRSVQKSVA